MGTATHKYRNSFWRVPKETGFLVRWELKRQNAISAHSKHPYRYTSDSPLGMSCTCGDDYDDVGGGANEACLSMFWPWTEISKLVKKKWS